MIPKYNKIHNRFKFNGLHCDFETLKELAYSLIKEGKPYEGVTGSFLLDWLNPKDFIHVNTSGSTGKPKTIILKKEAMVNSAIATGDFFGLKPGNNALHCLPSDYIAGKMMLVRALILGLEIDCIAPSTIPNFDTKKYYDFAAMVPLQLQGVIKGTFNIKTIIVGGSKVSAQLLQDIKACGSQFYETYGMTETVTHVALRQLETKLIKGDTFFKALPNVSFSQDSRNCLVIKAPKLTEDILITNDIVTLKSETQFQLLGRFDNVINSGGVKLFPEQIEEKLQSSFTDRLIIAGEADAKLGQKLILIIENPKVSIDDIHNQIKLIKELDKFEIPKTIYTTDKFIETSSGKIQRNKTIDSIIN